MQQRLVQSSWATNTLTMKDSLKLRHNKSSNNDAETFYPVPLTVRYKIKSFRWRFLLQFIYLSIPFSHHKGFRRKKTRHIVADSASHASLVISLTWYSKAKEHSKNIFIIRLCPRRNSNYACLHEIFCCFVGFLIFRVYVLLTTDLRIKTYLFVRYTIWNYTTSTLYSSR